MGQFFFGCRQSQKTTKCRVFPQSTTNQYSQYHPRDNTRIPELLTRKIFIKAQHVDGQLFCPEKRNAIVLGGVGFIAIF
jgi:hypothetical protein